MTAALSLAGAAWGYDGLAAVRDLSGSFDLGSMTAVVGANGSGKSTLLKGLIGLLAPLEGRVVRHGLSNRDIAYLPQQAEVDRSFPVSVIETVVLGLWRKTRLFRPVTPALWREAQQALATVGLDRFERRSIGSLSAGQFQRVMFARLLLQDSPVILLDEPFAAIDTKTADDLLGLVLKWHRDGRTVIAVLHDLDQVLTHFPRTLLIAREPIAWGESQEVLSAVHLSQARSLAHAWGDGVGQGQRGVAWTSTTR